jgi:hypothetical protein
MDAGAWENVFYPAQKNAFIYTVMDGSREAILKKEVTNL